MANNRLTTGAEIITNQSFVEFSLSKCKQFEIGEIKVLDQTNGSKQFYLASYHL